MIKLKLGKEPSDLRTERKARLSAAVAELNASGGYSDAFKEILDKGYQVARDTLYHRQYKKCAFCEKKMDKSQQPVEHFRPKKGAEDKVGGKWVMVDTHYWWLAWTWSNLYFACFDCNHKGHKGSRFPIEPTTNRIPTLTLPVPYPIPKTYFNVTSEKNLLLDPRKDDPYKHLIWSPVDRTLAKALWTWTVGDLDARGEMTIEVLNLGRREDEVNTHLKCIKVLWKQIDKHLKASRFAEAKLAWDDAISTYVDDPDQPFRLAAWCALDSLCPAPMRKGLGWAKPAVPVV